VGSRTTAIAATTAAAAATTVQSFTCFETNTFLIYFSIQAENFVKRF